MLAVSELESLWSKGSSPPDLVRWWTAVAATISPEETLQALKLDQRYRWQSAEPWLAETYLQALPGLPVEMDWRLELAIGEYEARRNSQQPLTAESLGTRFPEHSKTIQMRLQGLSDAAATEITATEVVQVGGEQIFGRRFRLDRLLGKGQFGQVYLAWDLELQRDVAIKIPAESFFCSAEHADKYLQEARAMAHLDHPHILPLYDVGRSETGGIYLVSRFIDGSTLGKYLTLKHLSLQDRIRLLIPVARALHHAHERGLVHRDIKPDNILIQESDGCPFVADFGLAIREEDYREQSKLAGTPAYMSPEQALSEGHRLDRRSDIFSLGVILYEMLTGQRPFRHNSVSQLRQMIISTPPTAPRELAHGIPSELERICLKALSKRATDRHSTAAAFAEDLEFWVRGAPAEAGDPAKPVASAVRPRGLRSFDADDAEFFPELLPGPRSRGGLPESIVFWKERIESGDASTAFSVGLLYGPSGCGKTSLVRAGLLPRLSNAVLPIYFEATSGGTEERLCGALRRVIPGLPDEAGLPDLMRIIRRGEGRKVTIFIDQFEQWLHGNMAGFDSPLVQGLRQCDGVKLQVVLMVRDDFAMAAGRLMHAVDVRLTEGENYGVVDLFDEQHATAVLIRFGHAFGRLPLSSELSDSQREFVRLVIDSLQQHGRIVSVQLALLAWMIRDRPWEPTTLAEIGGISGIGVAFLAETFDSPRANPRYRTLSSSVRHVLRALLPATGLEIRGAARSADELLVAAGSGIKPEEFRDLLGILDSELRLISPAAAEPSGGVSESTFEAGVRSVVSYQLTHDFLVPPLREWLTRNQKATIQGRAELALEEYSSQWSVRQEARYLPGLFDWLRIQFFTKPSRRTEPQKLLMQRASRRHGSRVVVVLAFLFAASAGLQHTFAKKRAESLARSVQTADPRQLLQLLLEADRSGISLMPLLQPLIERADAPDANPDAQTAALPARLVLVSADRKHVPALSDALLNGNLYYVSVIRDRLKPYAADLGPLWLEVLRNPGERRSRRFRAAMGLAGLEGKQSAEAWTPADLEMIASELTGSFSEYQPELRELLRPLKDLLIPELDSLFDAERSTSEQRINAAMALVEYATDDGRLLANLLSRADARQSEILYTHIAAHPSEDVRESLRTLVREQPQESFGQLDRVQLGRRRANAAIALLKQGDLEAFFPALRVTNDPESISQFVSRCRDRGVLPSDLVAGIERCMTLRESLTGVEKRMESRVIYGLLLALGSFSPDEVPAAVREPVMQKVASLYQQDPSAAVHSASGWLLREWGRGDLVQSLDEEDVPYDASGIREWFRLCLRIKDTVQPLTFVVLPAGEYRLGTPDAAGAELGRRDNEEMTIVRLSRPVALCDREVTWGLYDAMDGGIRRQSIGLQYSWKLESHHPACAVSWIEWVEFCRWLTSRIHGDDESLQCYEEPSKAEKDSEGNPITGSIRVDRGGFRMPTAAEWEAGVRSGQRTSFVFGGDAELLADYAWYAGNAGKKTELAGRKRPSIGGLMDVHGNVFEYVHDWFGITAVSEGPLVDPLGPLTGSRRAARGGSFVGGSEDCRVASRGAGAPGFRGANMGLRLAITPLALPGVSSQTKP